MHLLSCMCIIRPRVWWLGNLTPSSIVPISIFKLWENNEHINSVYKSSIYLLYIINTICISSSHWSTTDTVIHIGHWTWMVNAHNPYSACIILQEFRTKQRNLQSDTYSNLCDFNGYEPWNTHRELREKFGLYFEG